jgi:thiol-disulfide isomerase/thioredoxin
VADFHDPGDKEDETDDDAARNGRDMKQRQSGGPSSKPRWAVILPVAFGVLALAAIVIYAVVQMRRLPTASVQSDAIPTAAAPRVVGMQAPPFEVQTRMGAISSASLAGKPYLLELFATWCPHCQRMTAVLGKVRKQIPEDRMPIISVSASPYSMYASASNPTRSSQADVDAFDSTFGVTWPSAYDPNLSVARTWGLSGFPQIYVVNAKGVIVWVHSGEVPASTLIAAAHKAGA